MSDDPKKHPGFPGDIDADIEFSHGDTYYWTKRMTVWSIVTIVIAIIIVIALIAVTMNMA